MKQKEARKRAKELTAESKDKPKRHYIASTVPLRVWGGKERGWAVYQVLGDKLIWIEGTK